MLSKVVQDALNEQINNEFYSAYSYLAMSSYCQRQRFSGCAHWLRMQYEEENTHAMRLYDFLIARDGNVKLKTIQEPATDFESLTDVFEQALEQEQEVSQQIDALYELAFNEKSFSALVELEWFISEQVEEERATREIAHRFRLVQNDPSALLDLDRQLGERSSGAERDANA